MARILIVEDNESLARGLANNLEIEGYEVQVCGDGRSALRTVGGGRFDLVVLDLMLPDLDGYRILSHLRQHDRDVPVLILSAKGEEVDKVRGFRLGADDYVTKPFGVLELIARIDALLRRARRVQESTTEHQPIGFGEVELDRRTRTVLRCGEEVPLTPKEYDLLLALLEGEGAVLSRDQLLSGVWGHQGIVTTRTVDTHIAQLRRKFEADPAHPAHILTVRKVGYRLQV